MSICTVTASSHKIGNFNFQHWILKYFSQKYVLIKNTGSNFSLKVQFLLYVLSIKVKFEKVYVVKMGPN